MLKNKKLMLVVALPILILGIGYKMTRPKPVNKDKIQGTIYVMPSPFLLNLADGKFAKITVALELAVGQSDGASATAAASSSCVKSSPTPSPTRTAKRSYRIRAAPRSSARS
jgi:hypothetical protein